MQDSLVGPAGLVSVETEMFHQQDMLAEDRNQPERGADRKQKDVKAIFIRIQRMACREKQRETQDRAAATAEQRPEQLAESATGHDCPDALDHDASPSRSPAPSRADARSVATLRRSVYWAATLSHL